MVDHAREQFDPHIIRSDITDLRGDMCTIRDVTDRQITALRESMERRFAANDQRLDRLEWRIISALITLSAVVGGAIKYLNVLQIL